MHKRDIDALIATDILKWVKVAVLTSDSDVYYEWHDETGEFKDFYDSFDPTDCMSCAWLIVEKFDFFEVEKDNEKYFACIYTGTTDSECEDGLQVVYLSEAGTAPMAICLAALQSIGVEVKDK